jgi:hypothetical protein
MDFKALHTFGIATAQDIMRLQADANARSESQVRSSSLAELTFDEAVGDAHEALTGLVDDVSGTTDRRSLRDMLLFENRLRGLGVLLIGLALVGILVDLIMKF